MTLSVIAGAFFLITAFTLSYNIFTALQESSKQINWLVTLGSLLFKLFLVYLCFKSFKYDKQLSTPRSNEYV